MTSQPREAGLIDDLNAAYTALTAPGAPFSWSEHSVRGVPLRCFDTAFADMRAVWEMSAQHADAEYLVYGDERYSYSEVHARVRSLAHRLRSDFGAGPGTRVAVSMRNYPEWVIAHWAIISVGAAIVGMNAWWTRREMEFALADSNPVALILDGERYERLTAPDATAAQRPSTPDSDPATMIVTRHAGPLAPGVRRWDAVADAALAPESLPEADIDPDDDVLIFYTSGTTGRPKGAQLTHRSVVHNLFNIMFLSLCVDTARARRANTSGDQQPDSTPANTSLLPVPLFHVTGCNCVLHPITISGARLVLMYRWDPAEALEIIEREQVTTLTGVPSMSRELLLHPRWHHTDTSSLRGMGGGGAALGEELVHRIDEGLKRGRPSVGYGLTETSGIATAIRDEFYVANPGSVGPLMPCMEARIVDSDGTVLGPSEQGELLLRGPNVMKGYLDQPEATARAITDGWFRTGDIAEIDPDGWIHIKDRIKDIVIRGGENVLCSEVESALYEFEGVAEAAVFGVPDERLGEEVAAAIVAVSGAELSTTALEEHLRGRIARFKHPRHIWFLDEPLPRNANGKFVKRELRERFASGTDGQTIAAPEGSG